MSADTSTGPAVLWRPTPESIRVTRLAQFADRVSRRRGIDFGDLLKGRDATVADAVKLAGEHVCATDDARSQTP